ncbi:MAG: hypothetical protein NXI10_01335 [bacterium]|nr:hypothetical protein [bacterium]
MKKIKLVLLAGALLAMTTSCASLLENMDVQCEDDRDNCGGQEVQQDNCQVFDVLLDSNCE